MDFCKAATIQAQHWIDISSLIVHPNC